MPSPAELPPTQQGSDSESPAYREYNRGEGGDEEDGDSDANDDPELEDNRGLEAQATALRSELDEHRLSTDAQLAGLEHQVGSVRDEVMAAITPVMAAINTLQEGLNRPLNEHPPSTEGVQMAPGEREVNELFARMGAPFGGGRPDNRSAPPRAPPTKPEPESSVRPPPPPNSARFSRLPGTPQAPPTTPGRQTNRRGSTHIDRPPLISMTGPDDSSTPYRFVLFVMCLRRQARRTTHADRAPPWTNTTVAATIDFHAWATASRCSTSFVTALASMPMAPEDNIHALAEQAHGTTTVWHDFASPINFEGAHVKGIVRISIEMDGPVEPNDALRELLSSLSDGTDRPGEEPFNLVHTHDSHMTYGAAQRAFAHQSTSEEELTVLPALINAISVQPFVRARATGHRGDHDDRYPRDSRPYEHKRIPWTKRPETEIPKDLPSWGDSVTIEAYHLQVIRHLHSPAQSRIPAILSEQEPFFTTGAALLSKHRDHPLAAAVLFDADTSERAQRIMETTYRMHALAFEDAVASPENTHNQVRVLEAFQDLLASFRGLFKGTSKMGALCKEADVCCERPKSFTLNEGDITYLTKVDTLYSSFRLLWGDTLTKELAENGRLSSLMPNITQAVGPTTRDLIMQFWDNVIRIYSSSEAQACGPTDFIDKFNLAMERYVTVAPAMPTLRALGTRDGRAGAFDALSKLERDKSQAVRMLTCPADLQFVASCGFLISHWRPLFQRLLGSHNRILLPVESFTLALSDCDEPETGVLALTRGGGDRVYRPRPITPAAGPSGGTTTAPPRGVSFSAAADKIAHQADRVSSAMQDKVTSLSTQVTHLAKSMETSVAALRQHGDEVAAKQREANALAQSKQRDELAAMLQTMEKLMRNVANNATDLGHASTIDSAAAHVGASAKAAAKSILQVASRPPGRQRGESSDGLKLTHLPENVFSNYSPLLQAYYKSRNGVTDDAEFKRVIGDQICTICDPTAFNMPHMEKVCPKCFATDEAASDAAMGKVRAARARQKLVDRITGETPTVASMRAVAEHMDHDDDDHGDGHSAACVYFQQVLECDDDCDADKFVSDASTFLVEQTFELAATLSSAK